MKLLKQYKKNVELRDEALRRMAAENMELKKKLHQR